MKARQARQEHGGRAIASLLTAALAMGCSAKDLSYLQAGSHGGPAGPADATLDANANDSDASAGSSEIDGSSSVEPADVRADATGSSDDASLRWQEASVGLDLDAGHDDAAAPSDAGIDQRGDVNTVDARNEASAVRDAAPEASPPAEASTADAADASESPPVLLLTFDVNDPTSHDRWFTYGTPGTFTTVLDDRNPDNTNKGALEFQGSFLGYGGGAEKIVAFREVGNAVWTGRTKLHMWFKMPAGAPAVQWYQPFVDSGGSSGGIYNGYRPVAEIADGAWHEYIIPLSGSAILSDVNQVGIQLIPYATAPSNGFDADGGIPPVYLRIDDMWLE